MSKKKIAIIVGSLGRGGAERVTLYLAKHFKEKEIDPFIITALKRENEYNVPEGIRRINLQEMGSTCVLGLTLNLRKTVKKYKFDIIIIMDTPTCIYAIPACIGTGAVTIVSERNAPTHFSGKMWTKILSRLLMKFADNYVFQTKDAKVFYSKWLKERGTVIPNPLDLSNLPRVSNKKKKKVIVSVGRLDIQKNHQMMLKAFYSISKEFPEYKLIIYGEGSQRQRLEELIASLNLQKQVSLPGIVHNVTSEIKDASLFVFSSDFEGMPNALIEALAMGLPCVSTDCPCGGPAALINNGENGILTPVGDVEKFAKAMEYLLTETEIANQMGNKAALIRKELSVEKVGELWRNFVLKVFYEKKGEYK